MIERFEQRLQPGHFELRHFPQIRIGFVQHRAGIGQFAVGLLPLAIFADHIAQLRLLFGDFAILLRVVNDLRIRHFVGQLVIASLRIVQPLLVLHRDLFCAL